MCTEVATTRNVEDCELGILAEPDRTGSRIRVGRLQVVDFEEFRVLPLCARSLEILRLEVKTGLILGPVGWSSLFTFLDEFDSICPLILEDVDKKASASSSLQ